MTRSELEEAASLHEKLKRAEHNLDALAGMRVVGIMLIQHAENSTQFRIERGGQTGGGTVSSIGWSGDLEEEFTKALWAVFEARRDDAATELERLGVKAA
jgi:hypothetical protein